MPTPPDAGARSSTQQPRIDERTEREAFALGPQVWACYNAVFGDQPEYESWLADTYSRHIARPGFRLVTATEGRDVVGFAWGYRGESGQYWTDAVAEALPHDVASTWVGGHFEFVELGALPSVRGRGLGRALHDALLHGIEGHALLSTTDDRDDPAVRLYTRAGWFRIGALRPGVQVMARNLPSTSQK